MPIRRVDIGEAFVLTINTNIISDHEGFPSGSAVDTFVLPPGNIGIGTFNYTVDWGDGVVEAFADNAERTHIYSIPGIYDVAIEGTFPSIKFDFNGYFYSGGDCRKVTRVQIGDVGWLSLYRAFNGCHNLVEVYGFAETSTVSNMSGMFGQCFNLSSTIPMIYTNGCTDLSYMFANCYLFNASVIHFNTSNASNMNYMFHRCYVFNQPVTYFDTQNVVQMLGMFSWFVIDGHSPFQQSLATFNMERVLNCNQLFYGIQDIGTANYDATLISWAAQDLNNGLIVDFSESKYSAGAAAAARQHIIDIHGWTIVDGGQV